MLRYIWHTASGLVLLALLGCGIASAEDFRVDTEIFRGEEKEPAAETLTLFSNGLVYDFMLTGPEEIAIFDAQRGLFTLLDVERKVQASIRTQDLMDYVFSLSAEAAKSKDAVFSFAAQPKWEPKFEEFEENSQTFTRVTLAGGPLEYKAVGKRPPDGNNARAYHYFADWYARLNVTRAGLPPQARLDLNKALGDKELMPTEIVRTITTGGRFSEPVIARSRHLTNWTLSGTDRERIAKAGDYRATFKAVSFNDYRAPAPAGQNKQAQR